MPVYAEAVLLAGGMVIGTIVWLVRLEGRITVTESRFIDIIRRLERIETKQDHINRSHHGDGRSAE